MARQLEQENNQLKTDNEELKEKILILQKNLSELQEEIASFRKESQRNAGELQKTQQQLLRETEAEKNNLSEIKIALDRQNYLYNNEYERRVISSFYEYFDRSDFKERFMNLVQGMEVEDVALIVKILQRQHLAKETAGKKADLFSMEEQRQILEMKRELTSEVLKVSEDMYCYKNYFLPVNHFEASVFCYHHGIDCIEKIREKDVLDVGGFIGDSVLVLKPLTERRIITFEAVEKHYNLIKKTVELNNLDNVIIERMALGDHEGEIKIDIAGSSSSVNLNQTIQSRGSEVVPVLTLDTYIESHPADVGLIKVDIEGAEQSFLRGARKTIEKYKPVLLLSIYHNADDFFNIKPMIESWNLGYKFRIHKPIDYSVSREVLLIAEIR